MVCLPVPPLPHFVNYLHSTAEQLRLVRAFLAAPDFATRHPLLRSQHQPHKQLVVRCLPRMYVAHRGLNVIVSGNILQRKGPVYSPASVRKSMTQSVHADIGRSLHLPSFVSDLSVLPAPKAERFCRVLGACKDQATSISHAKAANSAVGKISGEVRSRGREEVLFEL
jgi:hypothetical protein